MNLSFGERVSLAWSLFWRACAIGVVSMLVSGSVGFGVGYTLAVAGCGLATIQVAGLVLGVGFSFMSWFVFVGWMLSARLGAFRLEVQRV